MRCTISNLVKDEREAIVQKLIAHGWDEKLNSGCVGVESIKAVAQVVKLALEQRFVQPEAVVLV